MRGLSRLVSKRTLALVAFGVLVTFTGVKGTADTMAPPVAPKQPHVRTLHGDKFDDDYFWLREKTNPAVTKYLEAENAYTTSVMQPFGALQDTLYKEMLGRIKQTDLSVPARDGAYFYYSRTEEGKQYNIFCRKKGGLDAPEEIYLDVNELAKGHTFMGIGSLEISDDANVAAYSTDITGFREYRLQVKDLRSGQALPDTVKKVTSIAWASDASGTPIPRASSAPWASLSPASGSTNTLMIFSGVSCATCSMSIPPSLDAIIATFCVARSVTAAT